MNFDNSPLHRRVLQTAVDLVATPMSELKVLDLACAHGQYAIEFALHGATVVGIEGRSSWLKLAEDLKRQHGLTNATFYQDDVRNLRPETYGQFDIVLCLGIVYHLDAPDVFEFIKHVAESCRGFAIFETHFSLEAEGVFEWNGNSYWGRTGREHHEGATDEEKTKASWASLDNELNFVLTKHSLFNLFRHVGFSSVLESRNPQAYMYVDDVFRVWEDRVTLVALRGSPVEPKLHPGTNAASECDWPEHLEEHYFRPAPDLMTKLVPDQED